MEKRAHEAYVILFLFEWVLYLDYFDWKKRTSFTYNFFASCHDNKTTLLRKKHVRDINT